MHLHRCARSHAGLAAAGGADRAAGRSLRLLLLGPRLAGAAAARATARRLLAFLGAAALFFLLGHVDALEAELGLAVGVALGRGPEPLGVELPGGLALAGLLALLVLDHRHDLDAVLALARGRAVRKQVEALRLLLDA